MDTKLGINRIINKKEVSFWKTSFFDGFAASRLLTQAEFFDDSTISGDVAVLQISQQRTAFTYQHSQSSFCTIILSVELKVLSQTSNTVGKQSYLSLS